ncbi:MAG: phosphohydrolase [Phycisphaeraceae bacterium]|nr:phosphohydrolase [Phycisphaeraceae bacterium]
MADANESPARGRAVRIVRTLQEQGHVAYLAGGCVRDRLLGLDPKDYDVATDATPERVRQLFPRTRFVGEAFGVVLVFEQGHPFEVATFRSEWGYEDGRRPDHVRFSDADQDAQRRDFTVNGLFEDPIAERIIDHVGGRDDLAARVIRAIGEPGQRFGEDYLRLLRAVRFAAQLDFEIEPDTAGAIARHAPQLERISRERIGMEMQAMLSGPRPARAATLLQSLGLDAPALKEPALTADLPTLSRLGPSPDLVAALGAWALDRHLLPGLPPGAAAGDLAGPLDRFADAAGTLVRRWRRALCLTNQQRDALRHCLATLPTLLAWPALRVAHRKRLMARPQWPDCIRVFACLEIEGLDALRRAIDDEGTRLEAEGIAPAPLLTGDDLIVTGRKPGPRFSRLLDLVYDAQLEGTVRTRDEALEWLDREAKPGEGPAPPWPRGLR